MLEPFRSMSGKLDHETKFRGIKKSRFDGANSIIARMPSYV